MATATLQSFNLFLTERLTAAAVDIFGFVEKTVLEYQEEVQRTRQENQRLQRLLDLLYQPEVRLHRVMVPSSAHLLMSRQAVSDINPILDQEEPGPSHIKEEEEKQELWTNGNEEQLSAEDSDEGDALTKELIKTVQELENNAATERNSDTTFKTHDGKGNFDCQICGKHIPCQSNLQNHMRVHTGERPYSCHFCGKSFKLKGHMTEHIRTHTGEKPFSCHICEKSFNRGSTLRKHVLVKHKEQRPYKCEDCDELFTERLNHQLFKIIKQWSISVCDHPLF
uniref:C2H2-type domain-containing protein n=1 Tax=Myripristis murdjan TaxID=586833 RepID=A0A667WQS0_9TELE